MNRYRSAFAATIIAVAAADIAVRADRAGDTLAVAAGGDLQAALDAAQPGDVIANRFGSTRLLRLFL